MVLLHSFGADKVKVTGKVGAGDALKRAYKGAPLLDVLDGGFTVELGRYGYRWFRLQYPGDRLAP